MTLMNPLGEIILSRGAKHHLPSLLPISFCRNLARQGLRNYSEDE